MKHMANKTKKIYNFPVIIEKDENGFFIGKVPALRSYYTQTKSLPELYNRLKEVVNLCLEVEQDIFKQKVSQNQFIGIQNLEFVK